mmetsp:Transcript_23364/g.55702  ORF Transcript_23364/g.55702 Transcript_23364/m.55702 type:complete len:201 (+) Transcript_23364:705-1307(+)
MTRNTFRASGGPICSESFSQTGACCTVTRSLPSPWRRHISELIAPFRSTLGPFMYPSPTTRCRAMEGQLKVATGKRLKSVLSKHVGQSDFTEPTWTTLLNTSTSPSPGCPLLSTSTPQKRSSCMSPMMSYVCQIPCQRPSVASLNRFHCCPANIWPSFIGWFLSASRAGGATAFIRCRMSSSNELIMRSERALFGHLACC